MARSNIVRIPQFSAASESVQGAIDAFLADRKSRNLSPRTLDYYKQRLTAFSTWLDAQGIRSAPADMSPDTIRQFVTAETERCSPAMGKHAYVSLRAFFTFLWREGLVEPNPFERMDAPRTPKKIITTIPQDAIEKMVQACDPKTFRGTRDAAILLVLTDCGLRASELCQLTIDAVDWSNSTLLVDCGKGGKSRIVPFGQAVRSTLSRYVGRRGELATRRLFVTCLGDAFNKYGLRTILERRAKTAEVDAKINAHSWRHTCAT